MSEHSSCACAVLAYQQSRAHIFSSLESLRWFMQMHRPTLVQAGAILKLAGRIHIAPSTFDDVVLTVGKQAVRPGVK
jgi:hypothetical protein